MTPATLAALHADVRRLRAGFAHTAPRSWSSATAAAEITVQLGHLAQCVLRDRGADTIDYDDAQRPITNIGDELADVLLASMSVVTLAGVELTDVPEFPPDGGNDEVEVLLRVLVSAGHLAEAAMVVDGYRHVPCGTPPSVPTAATRIVAACERLAQRLGLDLLAEFRTMVADAELFLVTKGIQA